MTEFLSSRPDGGRHLRRAGAGAVGALPVALFLLVALVAGSSATATDTQTWTREGITFRAGTFEGMQLTPDGRLAARPERTELARPEETGLVWDVALVDGTVYAAGGEGSGLWRYPEGGAASRVGGLGDAPEVLALVAGARGELFAATGPDGAVYRIGRNGGDAEELFAPPTRYVWDLAVDDGGALLVATGMPGRVYRVDGNSGDAEVVWEASDPHVRCVTWDPHGKRLLAGTSGSGWLVTVSGAGEPFVLWDSGRPEIVDIEVTSDGAVWAAASGQRGAAESGGTGEPERAEVEQDGDQTTVVVRASAAENDEPGAGKEAAAKAAAKAAGLPKGGGAVVRVLPGGLVEPIWGSNGDTPLAMTPRGDTVLVGTGKPARIWWFAGRGDLGWWDVIDERDVVSALAGDGERFVAATSQPATVVRYGTGASAGARWTSDVLDTSQGARFGRVRAVTGAAAGTSPRVMVRAGNTSEPGSGWTQWLSVDGAAGPADATGAPSGLPVARFLQLRVELDVSATPGAAAVDRVSVRYRPHNRPPEIQKIEVLPLGLAYRPMPPTLERTGKDPVVDPMLRAEIEKELSGNNGKWTPKKAFEPGALTVKWDGKDPDDDELTYSLEACLDAGAAECSDATLLAGDLPRDFFSFDARSLPDGVYRFRVTVHDGASNYVGESFESTRISDPVVVDHLPPQIETASLRPAAGRNAAAGRWVVELAARDAGGWIARAEVSAETGIWRSLAPVDGVEDGETETFRGELSAEPDRHPVVVRVVDRGGNVTTRRLEP